MSLLVGTPCYGGKADVPYVLSLMETRQHALETGFRLDVLLIKNESLIQRARNNIVRTFMEMDYERLMFIDSDIEFTPNDVVSLWNLDVPIAVGVYAMKRPDCPVTAWVSGKMVKVKDLSGPVDVDYAGTGFMMIKKEVFSAMMEAFPERNHEEGYEQGVRHSFSWFDPRVDQDEGIYLSEDYAFCKDAKKLGFKISCDPSLNLGHWGSFRYGP